MAGPIWLDRAGQVTTSSGVLTTITLGDVITGGGGFKLIYQSDKVTFGDWSYFIVRHTRPELTQWQIFKGFITDADTITVDTVYSSSNEDDSAVDFDTGNKYIILDASAEALINFATSGGTVTSVGLVSNSDIYTVTESPVTGSGNLTFNKTTGLAQRLFYATPVSGTGTIGLRALDALDIPDLSGTYTTPANVSTSISTALIPYSTSAQINTLLGDYLTIVSAAATYSTPATVTTQINTALTPYSTTSQINTTLASYLTISNAAATYSTPASVSTQISGATILTSQLSGNLPAHTHQSAAQGGTLTTAAIASGTFANSFIPWASPSAIGTGTPAAGTFAALAGTTGAFSNLVSITRNALGTTPTNGLDFLNTTAAAAGLQQISPATHWQGQGWKTTATAASQPVDFQAYVLPVEGTTAPTAQWLLRSSINGGAYSTIMTVDSQGRVGIGTTTPLAPLNVFASGSTAPVRIQHNGAANGDVLLNLVGGAMTGTHLVVNASANATVETIFRNQNNSTTNGAHATMQALVAGAGNTTGDAKMLFGNSSGRTFGIGYDQSADAFVIADGGTLGTSNRMAIDATGNVQFTGTVRVAGLRIDQTPVAATPTPTHTIIINLNGTDYRIPCVI